MTLFFNSEVVKAIHEVVISTGGTSGIKSKGMVESCLEYPFTYVYGYEAHPKLFLKAGALLYAFTTFHTFTDGNKRTALLATTLFLYLNGFDLRFNNEDDVLEFMLSVAKRRIRSIRRISKWLEINSIRNDFYGVPEESILSLSQGMQFPVLNRDITLELKRI